MGKRGRGRPRKYDSEQQRKAAKARWHREWRKKHRQQWLAIQRRADAKRRPRVPLSGTEILARAEWLRV